ncbi:fasciclin-like arabinogalactan protein 7 [Rhododendron vialii]|uniref:fasciclin-like arabinogalactan protein 7 n=1 Tax=Rhododendron vialii TaxID=182163 RepID=UPI00265DCAEB|nr:fasciclin-like arabinogalactan protein 7 [Rhododendron vialii]
MMDYFTVMFLVTATLLLSLSPPASSQSSAPVKIDLTSELTTEGPFATFLDLLQTSNTIQILQAQADKMNQDNTQDGLTLFAPNNLAFAALPGPFTLGALTAPELTSLCLFHALPQYYGTSNFLTLSKMNPVITMAGGPYTLNFTNANGGLNLSTGLSSAKVLQATASTNFPVAIYQIDAVLLPEAIFGSKVPPPPPSTPTTTSTPSAPPAAATPATPATSTPSAPPPPAATPAAPATSTPSAPPPPPASSTPTTTITIAHSAASLRTVGLGGWSGIVLGVSGGILLLL